MQQVAHAPEAAPASEEIAIRLECSGRARELLPIALSNALLTIVTLGIYRFWAKTRVRRYLWSRTSLLGDPFEYTGTGGELFRGFALVAVAVVAPLFLYSYAAGLLTDPEEPLAQLAATAPVYVLVLFLIGVALHRARRYRFSRTSWRGVRAAQLGSAARYGLAYLGYVALDLLSLGWTYPWTKMRLTAALTNDMRFGDGRFVFAGSARPLYARFAAAWTLGALAFGALLGGLFGAAMLFPEHFVDESGPAAQLAPLALVAAMIVLSPMLMAWYRAREHSWLAACTRYEGMQARYDVTAGALIRLSLGNTLLLLATLGLGGAFVELRNLRFLCRRLSFAGAIDVDAIGQSPAPKPARGEGLADAFDVGAV